MKHPRRPENFEAAEELLPEMKNGPASAPHDRFQKKREIEKTRESKRESKQI